MEMLGIWSKGTKPSTSSPSKSACISMRIFSIFWLKSTRTGITFAAVTGFLAKPSSKSLALLRISVGYWTTPFTFWMNFRLSLSFVAAIALAFLSSSNSSLSYFTSSFSFSPFSCRSVTVRFYGSSLSTSNR